MDSNLSDGELIRIWLVIQRKRVSVPLAMHAETRGPMDSFGRFLLEKGGWGPLDLMLLPRKSTYASMLLEDQILTIETFGLKCGMLRGITN